MSETTQDIDATRGSDPPETQPAAARSGRRSWLRWILVLLGIPLLVVLVLLLVILWVLGTESGLRFSLSVAQKLAPDLLQVERADGRILGDLHLEGLRVRLPGVELKFSDLDLRWRPLTALKTGTLRISELSTGELDIAIAPSEDENSEKAVSGPIELPELFLPWGLELELEQALVEQLSIGTLHEDSRFRIGRIALAASWSGSRVTLRELAAALPEPRLRADAQGGVTLTGDYPLDLELTWNLSQEPALQLDGQVRIGGDLEALHLEQNLTGSARAELQAWVREVLEHPSWEGELRILGVDLPAIQADLPVLDLSGKLTTRGDLDDAQVTGNLVGAAPDLPDFGRLRAKLDVRWRDRILEIADLKLTENKSGARLIAGGQLDLSDPAGKVDLAATWEKLRWPLVGKGPVAAVEQGALRVRGTLDQFRYQVSSEVRGRDFPAAKLQLTGEGNREAARIGNLRIDTLDGKVEAEGRVAWSPEPSWALTLTADGIDPGVQWPQLPARIGLELTSEGTPEAFAYDLDAGMESETLPTATLDLTGRGNREGARIEEFRLDTLGGWLQAIVDVTWAPAVTWDAELRVADMDPGKQWPEWSGVLDGRILSAGELKDGGPELEAQVESLTGELRGYPVDAAARVRVQGTRLTIDALRVASGPSNLRAAGTVGERLDLALSIRSPDLRSLLPDAAGSLEANGSVTGTREAPAVRLDLAATGVAVAGQRIQNLNGAAQVDLAPNGPLKIDLTGRGLVAGGLTFDRLRIQGDGDMGAHRLSARVAGEPLALDLELAGSLKKDNAYAGRLEELALRTQGFGNWRLQKAAPVALAGARIDVGPICIREETGEKTGSGGCARFGQQAAGTWNAALDLDRLAFDLFKGFIPKDLVLAGAAKAKADFKATGGVLTGDAGVRITQGVLGASTGKNEAHSELLDFTSAQLTVDAGGKGLRARLAVPLKGLGNLAGEVSLPGWSLAEPARPQQPLRGDVQARIEDFGIVSRLVPAITHLTGNLKADFKLGGTIAEPGLSGSARVQVAKGVVDTGGDAAHSELLSFRSAQLAVDADRKGLRARLAVPVTGLGKLSGKVSLPGWSLAEPARPRQPLRGDVQARIEDFGIVSRLVPDITQVTGKLNADFKLGGTIAKPGLSGSARLAGGGLQVPFIGLEIEDLTLDAQARGLDRIEYSGGFKAGKGRMKIDGHTLLGGAKGFSARISAKGNKLRMADSKEYFVLASPALEAEIGPTGTRLTGTVKVPEARIRPRYIPAGAVSPSSDVVIASKVREEAAGYATSIDLRLVLGRKVTVNAFGLEGVIKGELAVLQAPGKEIFGDGQLEIVDGTYRIYAGGPLSAAIGTPLTIEQGFLNYAKSPIANPYLVLTAQREGGDITAGLRVFGTLKHPKLTFFSATDPGLSQSEITKYLLTGIPPKRGGEQQDQAISLGTYIAPKLFAEYDYSLGDESDKIKLRYDLTDRIELQAETGEAQGGDIFFTIEH